MMKRIYLILMLAVVAVAARAGHVMIDGALEESMIYPGTVHTYQVYVPQQYDGKRAACLYVGLDGVLCNAPEVMDRLIAAGKMPVTIGVFLQPGVIKDGSGEVLRYNRSNEFDMTDGTFARFLENELLPKVSAERTKDGRKILLSDNADDRMIFGLSSGGICAFNAAWHRPDLFARVFSGVGTFVAMRGGNDLQAIVRKHEPQALRVYLQDGTQDVWNGIFGHWYEGNRMLASALDFAGYDAAYDWSDCNHGVKRATEIFANVMEWMWRDYPAPVKAGVTHNDLLAPMLEGQPSDWVETTMPRKVRPQRPIMRQQGIASYPDGSMHVSREEGTNWLLQHLEGENPCTQRFYWLHSYDNSLLTVGPGKFDSEGNLWVVTSAGLQILDQNGRVRGILKMPIDDVDIISELTIADGRVTISIPNGVAYTRQLNVKPAIPGQRPKSQGQG